MNHVYLNLFSKKNCQRNELLRIFHLTPKLCLITPDCIKIVKLSYHIFGSFKLRNVILELFPYHPWGSKCSSDVSSSQPAAHYKVNMTLPPAVLRSALSLQPRIIMPPPIIPNHWWSQTCVEQNSKGALKMIWPICSACECRRVVLTFNNEELYFQTTVLL